MVLEVTKLNIGLDRPGLTTIAGLEVNFIIPGLERPGLSQNLISLSGI